MATEAALRIAGLALLASGFAGIWIVSHDRRGLVQRPHATEPAFRHAGAVVGFPVAVDGLGVVLGFSGVLLSIVAARRMGIRWRGGTVRSAYRAAGPATTATAVFAAVVYAAAAFAVARHFGGRSR